MKARYWTTWRDSILLRRKIESFQNQIFFYLVKKNSSFRAFDFLRLIFNKHVWKVKDMGKCNDKGIWHRNVKQKKYFTAKFSAVRIFFSKNPRSSSKNSTENFQNITKYSVIYVQNDNKWLNCHENMGLKNYMTIAKTQHWHIFIFNGFVQMRWLKWNESRNSWLF